MNDEPALTPPPSPKPKFAWYQYIWIGWPIGLVAVGGAIGGLIGGAAWGINMTVFQKTANPVLRYVYTGLISLAAVLCYLVAAVFFLKIFQRQK
ncbi:MAG TPA: hypothetical protein VG733_12735 [Chthoniobacteraceae bacterium]|nr:hypothetical protein [Chthoniobacteraceae bacterium]